MQVKLALCTSNVYITWYCNKRNMSVFSRQVCFDKYVETKCMFNKTNMDKEHTYILQQITTQNNPQYFIKFE